MFESPPAIRPEPLPPGFYEAPADEVARRLLGSVLWRERADGTIQAGIITETEAYMGEHDKASHARFGRTPRTDVMYGQAGHAYIYLIYGMYQMLNVVCAPPGVPQAVLIRGIHPLAGIPGKTDGPGKLTRELAIGKELNRHPLWRGPLQLGTFAAVPQDSVEVTPRIGIDYAGEWRDAPLRWLVRQPGQVFAGKLAQLSASLRDPSS